MSVDGDPESGAVRGTSERWPMYLHLRNDIYYFKRTVPAYAAARFPTSPKTFWKSLKTTDFDVACRALATANRDFDKVCAQALAKASGHDAHIRRASNRQDGATKYLIPEYIPILIARFEQSFLAMDDEERRSLRMPADAGDSSTTAQRVQARAEELEGMLTEYRDWAAVEDWEAMEGIACALLEQERLIAPPGSTVQQEFRKRLLHKEIEILTEQLNRLQGKVRPTPPLQDYPAAPREMPTIRDLFSSWSRNKLRLRTVDAYNLFVAEFEGLHGALPVAAIQPHHVRAYRDWLRRQGKALETAKNRIGGLATLFRHGQTELVDHLTTSPFVKVDFSDFPPTPASSKRRSYELDELAKLFASPLYTGGYRASGQTEEALYWAPLLGTFTGARIEEIAQLRLADVTEVQGTWSLLITESGEAQQVKTRNSIRRIPVHDELVRCGFILYCSALRKRGASRVFPSLRNENKYRRWAAALSKRYAAYLDRIGLTDPRLDFHSLRYAFRQQCTLCGIPAEARDALTGHWSEDDDSSGSVYLKTDGLYPFPALRDAMSRLSYAPLDLTHLYL
jgi:integrase